MGIFAENIGINMNIAFILFRYFPYGGLQKDMLRMAEILVERGHNITILAGQWQGDKSKNIKVVEMQTKGLSNHANAQSFAKKVALWLKQNPQDKTVGFNRLPNLDFYYAADSCFAEKTKEKHNALIQMLPRYRIFSQLEKSVFARGEKTQLLMISPKEMQVYKNNYNTEDNRFYLLPPGINKNRIAPPNAKDIRQDFRVQHKLNNGDIVFLMVGSGFKTKGLDRSIDSLANLPSKIKHKSYLFVVGEDDKSPYLKQIEQHHLQDRVIFFGGRDDVAAFLLGSDVLLHPAYKENTGTVLLEAMVAGLPVIATQACGYSFYIAEAEMGYVIHQQDMMDKAIVNVLQKPLTLWQQRGQQFASSADIYRLHEEAANIIEGTS